jgi:pumilio family protein 6
VLQSILKYGTPAQVASLSGELLPDVAQLAKDPYGTHLVRRLIDAAAKEDLQALVAVFKPGAARLARHPFAAPTLDALYVRCTAAQRASLLATFYGPQVALARNAAASKGSQGASVTLASVLQAQATVAGRRSVLGHVAAALTPILEKGLVSFAYVHRLLAEFLPVVGAAGLADASASVAGPALLRMIHTPDGARAASMLLAGASARERKACVKALKGRVVDVATDTCGHVALVAALECIDDTTLLSKGLLTEVQAQLLKVVQHPTARRLVLNLLHPRCGRYLPPDIMAALPVVHDSPAAQAADGEAGAAEGGAADAGDGDDDEDEDEDDDHGVGDGKPGVMAASKKPPSVRRAQLLAFLARALVQTCSAHAGQLLGHVTGCDVIYEVARGGEGDALREAAGDAAIQEVVSAIAAAVTASETAAPAGDDAGASTPLREDFHASRTLRRLVLDSPQAAAALWKHCLASHVAKWAQGHGAKVLAACVACDDAPTRAAAGAAVQKLSGVVAKGQSAATWAAQFMHTEHADVAPAAAEAGQQATRAVGKKGAT